MNTIYAVLLCLLSCSSYAFHWQDLWLTADQQAQQLMNNQQYSQAESLFSNKAWQSIAAYRSGHYQQAAQLAENLNSESGWYNQGNALAHLNQYEQAIKAYNKALAINPKNSDALFNRKLVQELLKKKQQQQNQKQAEDNKPSEQNNPEQSKQEQEKERKEQQQKNKDQSKDKDPGQKESKHNSRNDEKKDNTAQSNDKKPGTSESTSNEGSNQDKPKDKDKNSSDTKSNQQQPSDSSKAKKQSKSKQADSFDSVKANSNQPKNKQPIPSVQPKTTEQSEDQLAKKQWLQLVPDDPGGLLREKFLRDYLRKQQGWYQ